MRAEGVDLVADNRDLTAHSVLEDLIRETGRTDVLQPDLRALLSHAATGSHCHTGFVMARTI
jgi:hypothetical protein